MQGNLFDLLITFDPYLFGEFERTTASFHNEFVVLYTTVAQIWACWIEVCGASIIVIIMIYMIYEQKKNRCLVVM